MDTIVEVDFTGTQAPRAHAVADVAEGQEFCLLVNEIASTGYRWTVAESGPNVEVLDDDVSQAADPAGAPVIGGARVRMLLFRRCGAARDTVRLVNRREFSGEVAGEAELCLEAA